MRFTLAGLLFLLSASAHAAETGSIAGAVTDAQSRQPMAGVQVDIDGMSTTTDPDGRFVVDGVSTGSQTIEFHHAGGTLTQTVDVRAESIEHADVALSFGGEVVRIEETLPPPPVKPATVLGETVPVARLPRSDALIESNRAAVVWLMTTVDDRGVVIGTHVMQSPVKLNLDEIAAAQARKLRFHPAVDAEGSPTFSHALVKVEWQPHWSRLMGQTWDAPCAGQGPLNLGMDDPNYRLCDAR